MTRNECALFTLRMFVIRAPRLHALAPGLTARSALEKFAAVQMIDVHLPTTDGREIGSIALHQKAASPAGISANLHAA